ncbi:hypothetical protein [Nocardia brasiliensis]|uniref:hypothetical protein n=1 Tax=Nocardia brasiliensis TaxID=37326 RepID=UPI003D79E05E
MILVAGLCTPAEIRNAGIGGVTNHLTDNGPWCKGIEAMVAEAVAAATKISRCRPSHYRYADQTARGQTARSRPRDQTLDKLITAHFREHPQAAIIESMPGMGPHLGTEFQVNTCGDALAEFGATTDAEPVLAALRALPDLLDKGPTKRVPAGYLDARAVAIDVVSSGWRPLVLRRGRPESTVERVAYVFCVLDLFHQRLRRRDIFATASSRWADPCERLLSGAVWEAERESLMNSLQLPAAPAELLDEARAELDSMWRHMPHARAPARSPSMRKAGCTRRRCKRSRNRRA